MKRIEEILDINGYKNLFLSLLSLPKDKEELILKSFKKYIDNLNNLENLKPIDIDENTKKIMKKVFNKSPKPNELINYKNDLKNKNKIYVCPYCGIKSLEEGYPIEHYLPKSKFSEYTLFGLNLFICCERCNSSLKRDKWEEGNRLFLNPYIDKVYDKEFIGMVVEKTNDKYKFSFELIEKNLESHEITLLKNHFKTFKLISRLDDIVSNYVDELLDEIKNNINNKALLSKLKEDYQKKLDKMGLNSVRPVIVKYFINNMDVLKDIYLYKNKK